MSLRSLRSVALQLFLAVALFVHGVVRAAALDAPMVLVATPRLDATPYEQSVVLALPDDSGSHFGFVLNKLTNVSLAQVLPQERAMPRMDEHVYVGGPSLGDRLFALVDGHGAAKSDLIEVAPDLFLAAQPPELKRVLADRERDAHFYVGMVGWRRGELEAELRAGSWIALEPEVNLVMSADPDQQWQRLVAVAHSVRVVGSYATMRTRPPTTDAGRLPIAAAA